MIPRVIPGSRQLSSTPQTHRTATLRAIAEKTHAMTERIEYLKVEGQRTRDLLQHMPDDVDSRLAWLSSRLNAPNL